MGKKEKIAIIYNPNAGQNRKHFLSRVLLFLEENNISFSLLATEKPNHATKIAEKLIDDDEYTKIVAAGGDGTINEVINGLYGSDKALGIIPLGTVSVLAREVGLDLDPKHVADAIIKRKIINIFPAMIEGRCFSLMASVGIDALSVKNVNLRLKKAIGKSAYVFSFIREAMKSKNNSHMVKIKKVEHKSYYTIIAKGRYYAGEYICAPDATIEDKNLHVVMLKKKGLFELFKFFWAILRNKVSSLKHVDIIAASALTVFSKNEEAIQIDGDYYGQLPVTINVAEKAIKLIGPAP